MMAVSPRQSLPNLAGYREEFVRSGVRLPLPVAPVPARGLLASLPKPPVGRTGWPWTVESQRPEPTGTNHPVFSIVVPSFRQGRFIEETIRSLLLQNYPSLQVIVIDGGSDDGTVEVLERYRPWLSFVRHDRDRGQAHAINLGFSLADGQLRGWLNSDDFYLPGTLQRVSAAYLRTGAQFIYGDQLVRHEESGIVTLEPMKLALDRYIKFPALVASHAAFWTAPCHQPVWEEHHCAMDYELWIRLLPNTRKCYVPWPLGLVRHHESAKTFSSDMKAKWDEDAVRNGQAHPELYRNRPWLDWEYRYVQGIVRRWRSRRVTAVRSRVFAECGWPA